MVDLIGNVTTMITEFTNIALSDPLSAILILFGSLFVGGSVLAFTYLTLGAVVDLVTPEVSEGPARQA
ncbi:hypothetical protein ACFR9U_12985 [Halorientalis brevis]|uniref:Uncharacterized protein n=1 Tax=Halorientalis brevis TaxID=1126241 RepID=A0ABD6CE09_9EURY|nr:hypothetical protein [Halorientalis brevis]